MTLALAMPFGQEHISETELHVLAVDDEAQYRSIMTALLTKMGHACETASDASEALTKIRDTDFDLVITDIRMPGLDGVEMMREAGKIKHGLDFIIMTGFTADYSYCDLIAFGASDYIAKPFEAGELEAKIQRIQRERALVKRLRGLNRESENRSAEIFDFLPDATFAIDRQGKILAWNRAIEEMTGAKAEDMLGKGNHEYALPFYGERRPMLIDLTFEYNEEAERNYLFVEKQGPMLLGEADSCRVRGEKRSLWGISRALCDIEGAVVGAIESIRDVTEVKRNQAELKRARDELERRVEGRTAELKAANISLKAEINERMRAESALRQSEQSFRSLFENHHAIMLLVEAQSGMILDVNASAASFYGYSRAELKGMNLASIARISPGELITRLKDAKKGVLAPRTFSHRLRNGEVRTVEVHSSPIEMNGRTVFFSIVHDITERRRAEKELRKMHDYLENIFANSPDGIGIVDEHGKFIRWNRMAAGLFGYSFNELRGKSSFDLYADKDDLGRMLTALRDNGSVKDYAIAMKKKDGTVATFELSISLLRDNRDRIIGSICVARDMSPLKKAYDQLQEQIEERRNAEEALRESERRFRDILENVHFVAVCLDVHGNISFCNDFFLKLMGRPSEEILGKNWVENFLPDEQKDAFRLIFAHAITEGEIPAHYEGQIITPRGEKRLIEWNSTVLYDMKGKVVGATCIGQDITEARRAEEDLRSTYTEMAQLLASIPSFLIGLTTDRRIIRWNGAAERTFGIPAAKATEEYADRCGIQWDWQKMSEAVSACHRNGTAVRFDSLRFVRPDGKEGFLDVTVSPVGGSADGASGTLLLGSDVTKRKILEGQLVQAQKLESIGQLAAGIAHEINTPAQYVGDNIRFLKEAFGDLGKIEDHCNLILESAKSGEDSEALVEKMEAAREEADFEYVMSEIPKAIEQSLEGIDRISRIVRAMKEFSHPGTDVKTHIDLNKAIESTITVARNEWKYYADMETEFDHALPLVPCLPGEFNQVVLNLIINAAHAISSRLDPGSSEKGKITVTTRTAGDCAEIRIRDTGTGIREDIRTRIFDPFFTTKEVGKGTGQGLAIARSVVVDKHGGTITFESEMGKGTTFIVRLPLNVRSEQADT